MNLITNELETTVKRQSKVYSTHEINQVLAQSPHETRFQDVTNMLHHIDFFAEQVDGKCLITITCNMIYIHFTNTFITNYIDRYNFIYQIY